MSMVPRFNVHTATYDPLPEFGGQQAILYKSDDGTRLAGSFQESGRHTMVMPFDEFIYVVTGGSTISVDDGEPFTLSAGDCCYLRQGTNVTFEMTDDFHDVTVLISDKPIDV
ncbi:cupin domain-containing protein [uncultured Jatrophihabitans sp.]|uniref:cupin domain-containing protein n=1 Tax=uncultured Jatrophihabitans sp. TaxID=1610747 RepID=UPI0035CB7D91